LRSLYAANAQQLSLDAFAGFAFLIEFRLQFLGPSRGKITVLLYIAMIHAASQLNWLSRFVHAGEVCTKTTKTRTTSCHGSKHP
jgi:hypothetical protein